MNNCERKFVCVCVFLYKMSSPSDETVVRLILSEIKDGNPFKDTKNVKV